MRLIGFPDEVVELVHERDEMSTAQIQDSTDSL